MKGILIDDTDLVIAPVVNNGLIVSGVKLDTIDYQRALLIINAHKGEFKEHPTLGFGIDNYLKSITQRTRQQFISELTQELKSDGISAKVTIGDDLSQLEINL